MSVASGSSAPESARRVADREAGQSSQPGGTSQLGGESKRHGEPKRRGEQQRSGEQKRSGERRGGGEQKRAVTQSSRVRSRRHWGYVAAGVGLMLVTGVIFATVWVSGRDTAPVLALTRTVHRGEELKADDLTVAHAVADPALVVLPANRVADVVGQRAALDLPAGSLLNPQALVNQSIPGSGQALVGLHLSPAQLPLTDLNPGDSVTIVHAGHEGEVVAADSMTVSGVVVTSGVAEDGSRKVDVTVPTSDAAAVAGWVATGRAAVYLESEEG